MTTKTVGIRELEAQLGAYLQQVKDGTILVITERGKPIGRIVPIRPSLEERTRELMEAGLIKWSGRKLKPRNPGPRLLGNRTAAELLLEDRD